MFRRISRLAEHASTTRACRGWATQRPDRWQGFREDYRFTGKEEDVEVGLQYFGKRFLSAHLGRWVSPDPLGVHVPGEADLNLYAYVKGQALRAIDPLGLQQLGGNDPRLAVEEKKFAQVKQAHERFIETKTAEQEALQDQWIAARAEVTKAQQADVQRGTAETAAQVQSASGRLQEVQERLDAVRGEIQAQQTRYTAVAEAFERLKEYYTAIYIKIGDRGYVGAPSQIQPLAERRALAQFNAAIDELKGPASWVGGPKKQGAKLARTAKAARGAKIPFLRGSKAGPRLHGDIPHRGDLRKMTTDQLVELREATQTSLRTRTREMAQLGDKGGHGRRIGQERNLLENIEDALKNRGLE